jgi:H/ACA ribonucleoprotein complex subunit 3
MNCPKCDRPTENTFPPRYSPEDKYGKYRRMYYLQKDDDQEEIKEK